MIGRFWLLAIGLTFLAGCVRWHGPAAFDPDAINTVRFRDRLQAQADADMRVSTAVPTAAEVEALFDADLVGREIQPVWVKVENHSDDTYYLISAATDPNHFSPLEVAYAMTGGLSGAYRTELADFLRATTFRNPILPHTTVSGFIFTNLDEGEKVVQVDLIAAEKVKFFTFFVQIPGMRVDYQKVNFTSLYPPEQIMGVDEAGLRAALEQLPCCTTDRDGMKNGDPLNLVVIGEFREIVAAFSQRGWLPAEETYATAVWKTIKSFLFGSNYRYSPVSPLYHAGRPQDFARQKPRHDIHERNHLRLWYTPLRLRGKPVFVGQVSRDIGVRLALQAWPPVTHKIDPDIDEARHALVEDLVFSQKLLAAGFVKGVGAARPSKPGHNLTGDPYFTDGYRLVLILDEHPTALDEIKALRWEEPTAFRLGATGSP